MSINLDKKMPIEQLPDEGGFIDPKRAVSEDAREVVISEEGNPWTIANMLTGRVKERFLEIPVSYFGLSEKHMENLCRPTEIEEQLRLAFWDEYTVAMDAKRSIQPVNIYSKVCSKDFFYDHVISNPTKFAYVLAPPPEYMYQTRALLALGRRRLRQVLEMPLKNGKNEPNVKLISEIVKIVNILENRVHGAVAQNINVKQQTKNLNVNVEAKAESKELEDLDKIEREIELIKRLSLPEATDTNTTAKEHEAVTVKSRKL